MKRILFHEKDIHKGTLILINKDYSLKIEREDTELRRVSSKYADVKLEITSSNMLAHLIDAVHGASEIIPISGYRSLREQEKIYKNSLRENGRSFTEKYVALPNHSEHQTGLAIDLALKQQHIDFICPSFPYEGICNKFREMAPFYGFIERYQKGKEKVTGISHEPWHFRYIGWPHSLIIKECNYVLEEYISYLRTFPYEREHLKFNIKGQNIEIFFVNPSLIPSIELPNDSIYQISGNNVDGLIVTLWK